MVMLRGIYLTLKLMALVFSIFVLTAVVIVPLTILQQLVRVIFVGCELGLRGRKSARIAWWMTERFGVVSMVRRKK